MKSLFIFTSTRRQRVHRFVVAQAVVHQQKHVAMRSARPRLSTRATASTQRPAAPPSVHKRVLLAGATGYIGKQLAHVLAERGHSVVALVRPEKNLPEAVEHSANAVVRTELTSGSDSIADALRQSSIGPCDAAVSCLATRGGGVDDSWLVEHDAVLSFASAARQVCEPRSFVLLSAICVQRPELEFQRAKLEVERKIPTLGFSHFASLRPTAYFKSLGAQIELVQNGWPYIVFGNGYLASCKPISERDVSLAMSETIENAPTEQGGSEQIKANAHEEEVEQEILPIGGPGPALSAKAQGELLYDKLEVQEEKKRRFVYVPIQIMDAAVALLSGLSYIVRTPQVRDAAEFARIGRYYAQESMLVYNQDACQYEPEETPEYGTDTLGKFYERAIAEGMEGQELGEQAVLPSQRKNKEGAAKKK